MAMIAAWTNFLGMNTKVSAKRLAEGYGTNMLNCRLGFGELRKMAGASTAATPGGVMVGTVATIYRLDRNVIDDTGDWLWWDADVDVVRSMIPSDTSYEIFYTGDGAPKRTTAALALPATPAPAASRPLGIPQPDAMMSASVLVAGSGPTETRTYIDTFVTTDGLKEGAPNTLPRTVSVAGGSTMTLGSFDPVPGGYADVTLRRVYVSVSGSEYLLCAEGLASAGTLTDSLSRTTVLQSGGDASKPAWLEPPSDLKGLIALWNGMIGGFRGKELCICEPYKGWAWPSEYRIPLHDEIVGTGVWGQNWVVITTAGPYIVTGSSPLNMLPNRLPFDMSCSAKRSAVSMRNGVAWASEKGVCYVGEGAPAAIVTENYIDPDGWASYGPSSMVAARFENSALFFINGTGTQAGLVIDPRSEYGFSLFQHETCRGAYYDTISDRVYYANNDGARAIYRPFNPAATGASFSFTSKTVRHTKPVSAGYVMVISGFEAGAVTCLVYGDGALLATLSVLSEKPVELPGGSKARDFLVVVSSSSKVQGILLAEDASDFP